MNRYRLARRWNVCGAVRRALCVVCGGVGLFVGGMKLAAQSPAIAAQVPAEASRVTEEVLSRRITLTLTRVSLKRAIDSISRTANVLIEYQVPMLTAQVTPITLAVTDEPLGVVLERVLDRTMLRVISGERGHLTIVASQEGAADSVPSVGVIIGRVVDSANGQRLGGATVKVAGTRLSAVTTDSGWFTVRAVPVGEREVQVKLFGYRMISQPVSVTNGEPATIRVLMAKTATVLAGVVTTAIGVQERRTVGNDITVLNADSIMRVAPVTNLTDMLATRVPGLIVQNTSGIPGAPSRLRLRGPSSLTVSDDPILIVDGIRVNANQSGNTNSNGQLISGGGSTLQGSEAAGRNAGLVPPYAGPAPLDQIDPNSIETIEVLKGPSATATYGSDAANGVIVITTKRGRTGPAVWNLSMNLGRTSLPGDWPSFYHTFVRSALGGTVRERSGFTNFDNPYVAATPGDILVFKRAYQALNDPQVSPLGTGSNRDATLSVRGGSGPVSYAVTGTGSTVTGYLHLPSFVQTAFQATHGFPAPRWMIEPTMYKTYSGTSNLTSQLGSHGATLSLTSSMFRGAQQQSALENTIGNLQFQYVDPSSLAQPWTANALADSLFPNYATRAQFNTTTFNSAATLTNWELWRWLPPISATAGLSVANSANNLLTPRDYILNGSPDTLGSYAENRGVTEIRTLDVSTSLNQWGVRTSAGINVIANTQDNFSASTTGLGVGVEVPTTLLYTNGGPTQTSVHTATYGWYLQPSIDLNSRFFVNPGFRFDGGSASGNSRQLNLFPKLDVSYIAVDRPEAEGLLSLSVLRPRIAFGIAGVQPDPGQQLRLMEPNQIIPVGSSTPVSVATIATLGNTQLKPERSRELEGGFDVQFGKDQQLSVSLTGYNKTRFNAIMSIPVAPSVAAPSVSNGQASGGQVYSYSLNVGTVRNTGIEASVLARLLDARSIGWTVNANLTQNHNRVIQLDNNVPAITTYSGYYKNRILPGYPLDGIWARPIVSSMDVNGDGFVDPTEIRLGDSLVYLGAPTPNYEMTLGTTVSLFNNRVQVNTTVDYQNGMTQNFSAGSVQSMVLASNDPSVSLAQQAGFVAAATGQSAYGIVQTVNMVRWNTLSVSYLVPPEVVRVLRVPSLSLALQGSNLGLHSNYRGKDPNVNAFATGNLTSDAGQLPQPRTWSLRVSIGN